MNKRDLVLAVLEKEKPQTYIPAGFFLHFAPEFHLGKPAIDKHLDFFRFTEMDFVKIQYEHTFPRNPDLTDPSDWAQLPRFTEEFFAEPLKVVEGLVKSAKSEALVFVTLYSPFMIAGQINGQEIITRHILENPQKAKIGIEIVADAMLTFVKACIRLGVDGFYTSTQGAESYRLPNLEPFYECIKPFDLYVMNEAQNSCLFNILHICDYHGSYSDLSPFLDYPGHVVNCSLILDNRELTAQDVSELFQRPYMGGLERKGRIATGSLDEIKAMSQNVLQKASAKFIFAADCTVPSSTPWENLREAVRAAHSYSHNG